MTNNITLAFIDIDPPVNILLEPKQETTDFMLAETYKLLILRIMTTEVEVCPNKITNKNETRIDYGDKALMMM